MKKMHVSKTGKYYLGLVVFSMIWYAIIAIDQLRRQLDCTPTDGFCNSGNTVLGDLTWAWVLWGLTAAPVWFASFMVTFLIGIRSKNRESTTGSN